MTRFSRRPSRDGRRVVGRASAKSVTFVFPISTLRGNQTHVRVQETEEQVSAHGSLGGQGQEVHRTVVGTARPALSARPSVSQYPARSHDEKNLRVCSIGSLGPEPEPASSFIFHRLRQSRATRLVNAGSSGLTALMVLGGWKNLNSVQFGAEVITATIDRAKKVLRTSAPRSRRSWNCQWKKPFLCSILTANMDAETPATSTDSAA